ncbi:hypothetical protein LZB33_09225, partial [Campylobacter jejuni]|uniref:hypothetical protein n=1 Tax=Campylobacter jejuni TaxID=197 RepID=UPI001F089D9A
MPLVYVDKKRGNNVQQMLTCFQKVRENIYLSIQGHAEVAQRLKRLPAMRETRVRSLGREDPLE